RRAWCSWITNRFPAAALSASPRGSGVRSNERLPWYSSSRPAMVYRYTRSGGVHTSGCGASAVGLLRELGLRLVDLTQRHDLAREGQPERPVGQDSHASVDRRHLVQV